MNAERLGNIKLYNADCMEVMNGFKDKQFDLAIVDPPYFEGVGDKGFYGKEFTKEGRKKGDYKPISNWNQGIPTQSYFDELIRVSKNQIVWGVNYYPFTQMSSGRIIWDKNNDASTFSNCEIAYNSLIKHVKIFRYTWNGMLQENMKNKQKRIHPTEKPVQLYKWLLQNYAKEGDKILDTHFGSLSIGIACHDMGFELTAIELDKDYYEQAKKRLMIHQRQLTIF